MRDTVVDLACRSGEGGQRLCRVSPDGADVVTGSFFDPLTAGAGGYIVSAVLSGGTPERCRRDAAAGPGVGSLWVRLWATVLCDRWRRTASRFAQVCGQYRCRRPRLWSTWALPHSVSARRPKRCMPRPVRCWAVAMVWPR